MASHPPGPPPAQDRKKEPVALLKMLRRMPLRTRLILAFVVLIVSSASATILIGSTLFGRRVDGLAREKASLFIRYANDVFEMRLEKMRFLMQHVAARAASPQDMERLAAEVRGVVPTDFVLYLRGEETTLLRFAGDGVAPGLAALSPQEAAAVRDSFVGRHARAAAAGGAPVAGLLLVDRDPLLFPGAPDRNEKLLVLLAAAPLESGAGIAAAGYYLNGRTDILERIRSFVAAPTPRDFGATIFIGTRRVSTILGKEALGTSVDAHVAERVIKKGATFTGVADVVGLRFYTSYIPLKDMDGRVVGMMGVGTKEDVYAEVRRNTITLFSALIAGGMIFGFIMTYLFSAWLVKPVGLLAGGMSRVAEGDLTYKVRIETADELGRLARAFNQMVRAVKERDHKLREMTEDRLTAVEKQISIGRLAAGVAHEINNPLTAVLSLSSLVLKKLPPDDPRRDDLEIVTNETRRCREIVRSLLDFAKEQPTEKRIVDVNRVIRDTLTLTNKYDEMERVEVILELAPRPLMASADPKQLQQVFMNLLLNAAHATAAGGTIRIASDEDSSGGFVQVQVKDTGKGIPKEHLGRVFEPFFTTKGAGKGTGLGLSVSLGIIQKHDGAIELDSEEAKGTTVTVSLPRVTDRQAEDA